MIRDESMDKDFVKLLRTENKSFTAELLRIDKDPDPFSPSKMAFLEARIRSLKGLSPITKKIPMTSDLQGILVEGVGEGMGPSGEQGRASLVLPKGSEVKRGNEIDPQAKQGLLPPGPVATEQGDAGLHSVVPAQVIQSPSNMEEIKNDSSSPLLEGKPEVKKIFGVAAVMKTLGTMLPKVEVGAFEGEEAEEEGSVDEYEESTDEGSLDDCEGINGVEEDNSEDEAEVPVSASTKVSSELDTKLNLAEICTVDVDSGSADGSANNGKQIDDLNVLANNAHQVLDRRTVTSFGKKGHGSALDIDQIIKSKSGMLAPAHLVLYMGIRTKIL
ncbi:hypothetical protein U1Q18_009791 [Sarracenia purpurea var. burkii]